MYEHYSNDIGTFVAAASEAHDNVIKYEAELNDQGLAAFVGIFLGRYDDFAYALTRAFYLTVMESHFKTYVPGSVKFKTASKEKRQTGQFFAAINEPGTVN